MSKNIIVTGGAQGIGKITSLELLKNGYSVSVFEIDEEAIELAKANPIFKIGGNIEVREILNLYDKK